MEVAARARDEVAPGGWVAASIGPYAATLGDGSEFRGDDSLGVRGLRDWHRRRLQVLAQSFEGPVFLFRPLAARHDPSPAPLRLQVTIDVDWALDVLILKRKGPAHETPLQLASIPGGLDRVLTPRVMRPSTMRPVAPIAPLAPVVPAATEAAPAAASAALSESPRAPQPLALFPELTDVVGRPDPAASSAGAVR